jgi:Asp-tRNA(Asn)/Glu-tRNA(Gln) amidotransferase B subunit
VLKGELTADEFGTVIDAIFDEVVTDEVLIETFTAVLETELNEEKFEAVVAVLESETISNEQVAEVVTLIIEQEGGVNAEQATELATSAKVLESIDGEQATEVFDAVVASEVSPEDGLAISEAVQEAPKKVRKAFEKELNIFEGVFDVYVPMGSRVPVGDRRVIVGVGAVLLSVPVRVRVG